MTTQNIHPEHSDVEESVVKHQPVSEAETGTPPPTPEASVTNEGVSSDGRLTHLLPPLMRRPNLNPSRSQKRHPPSIRWRKKKRFHLSLHLLKNFDRPKHALALHCQTTPAILLLNRRRRMSSKRSNPLPALNQAMHTTKRRNPLQLVKVRHLNVRLQPLYLRCALSHRFYVQLHREHDRAMGMPANVRRPR